MDLLDELESMAINISDTPIDMVISDVDLERWQILFGLSRSEAAQAIEAHRNDFTKTRISDELWAAVKSSKESDGFDREAYEYSVNQKRSVTTKAPTVAIESGTFIVQLAGPLHCAEAIREAAQLNRTPHLATGVGEHGQTQFCEIDASAKIRLLAWLAQHHAGFRPTIVRLGKAKKDLCSHTLAPMLGLEPTLPLHRAVDDNFTPMPGQYQYPVWYFFYGTLADPQILRQHLGLEDEPTFVPAHVCGGQVGTWAGKYKALVDASMESKVFGSAFLVTSREQEDTLRFYETDKYDVVRCRIITEDGALDGLTFRFNGIADLEEGEKEEQTVKPRRFCTRGKRGGKKDKIRNLD
ncbi:hypothetical protein, variant 2 [Exophiala sideris]|uniref:Putative gamma-glutamylcyclotransferase n=1 Tax=Exophiala sideris TaxID=1016849 RepID=A0A0D1ZHE7_9EURO|nr:hypothetical protein PV11_01874 [Exophiala sideris]KIV86253.1 hypothetical protein, variant 1 [Exophiala sideris]KIV86254.1 hypothetical protein, variant 2 [Exophiala sideris]